jgi:hypothetical protein
MHEPTPCSFPTKLIRVSCLLGSLAILAACGSSAAIPGYLPGNSVFFSVGSMQDKEYFSKNVAQLQSSYVFYPPNRFWEDNGADPEPTTRNLLRGYRPLSVRWELKDGRQFVASDIDVEAIMREFSVTRLPDLSWQIAYREGTTLNDDLKMRDVKMQWQAEERRRIVGDYDPSLVYEIYEDEVRLKWLVRSNKVPLERRGQELPDIDYAMYPVAVVKAKPATGLDFAKHREPAKAQ